MNKERRSKLEKVHEVLIEVKEDEEAAFENMPESLQCSERGEKMEENFENLDSAIEAVEAIIND